MKGTESRAAYLAWTEHRFFAYRGCAPDPDNRQRAAGNPGLSLDAWHGEDRDGGEPQRERRAREAAAIEVCLSCPVMVQCDRYANTVTVDGKLAEPDGIRGGRTARERRDGFEARRHEVPVAVPDARFRTPQRQAVLLALAMCVTPGEVAAAAGLDVRTANWQRSRMTTDLNLCKTRATRRELLAEAVRRGLLDGSVVVADDGTVPAVPPSAAGPRASSLPVAASERAAPPAPRPEPAPPALSVPPVPYEPSRVPAPRRDRFTDVDGQLALWEAELTDLAPVHSLFPAEPLEAAA